MSPIRTSIPSRPLARTSSSACAWTWALKVNQRVNAYLRQIVGDLMASGELPPQHHTYSIYETRGNVGDFRFCMLRKMLAPETDINRNDHRVMAIKVRRPPRLRKPGTLVRS